MKDIEEWFQDKYAAGDRTATLADTLALDALASLHLRKYVKNDISQAHITLVAARCADTFCEILQEFLEERFLDDG
jgi:hypothetical protein